MKREQIIEFEQITRTQEDLFKSKYVNDLINKIKKENKKILLSLVSTFIALIYCIFNLINVDVVVIATSILLFNFFFIMEYTDRLSKIKIKKEYFNNIFIEKYNLNFSLTAKEGYIEEKEYNKIKEKSEEYMENVEYDKIEYAILFFYERYINSNKEDQKKIEKRLNNLKNKSVQYKEQLANRKEILNSVIKDCPQASDLFDSESLLLTKEEENLTNKNKKLEYLRMECEKKVINFEKINVIDIKLPK